MKANLTLLVQVLCLAALVALLLRPLAPDPPGSEVRVAAPSFDEAQLRRIIREEIHAAAAGAASSAPPMRSAVPAEPVLALPRDPVADAEQRDFVEQQFAYLMSVGQMSDSELVSFQQEIAKLDPADAREMLNRLARAINTGRIKQGIP